MDQKELRDLLKVYRKHGYEEGELKKLWELLSDDNNEEQVKSGLFNEISTFDVDSMNEEHVDFDRMFTNIDAKISTNQPKLPLRLPKRIFSFYKAAAILVFAFFIGGALSYIIFNKTPQSVSAFTIIKAPYGAKSEVILPDGSHVWINAGSSIKYDNNYNKTSRTLLLEGEAYFKVAKNKDIPFIVNTADIDIVAVGTEFNVKAYADED
jgi:transmembrane sensor